MRIDADEATFQLDQPCLAQAVALSQGDPVAKRVEKLPIKLVPMESG